MLKARFVQVWIRLQNMVLHCLQWLIYSSKPKDFQPKNICVYRIGNIGDLLCTIPALWQIRRYYPKAKITLLSSPGRRGAISAGNVLSGMSCLDDIQLYYYEDIHEWQHLKSFRKHLQTLNFDYFLQIPVLGASFLSQVRNILFFRFVGFSYADSFFVSGSALFSQEQMKYLQRPNEVERCLQKLPFQHDGQVNFGFVLTKDNRDVIDRVMKENLKDEKRPVLAVSFSGKRPVQRWPLEFFSKVAEAWIRDKMGCVVVIGGSAEKKEAEEIIQGIAAEVRKYSFNFCGVYSIIQSIGFLQRCKLLLTIDTGTAHMAPVAGIPCIDLCSAYNLPNQWYAYGDKVKIIRKNQACSPCGAMECRYGKEARCMRAITPDDVWQQIMEL